MSSTADAATRGERAYERLRAEILHGALIPGERLRAAHLEERFGLGLTPIREALARLSSEGLVAARQHRGPHVAVASPEDLADLMRTRRQIERLCLEGALAHGDAAWEAEIVAALHLLSRAALPRDPRDRATAARWEAHHRRFHAALVAACGSEWLLRFWGTLSDHTERYRMLRVLHHRDPAAEVRDVGAEHRALAEAALARDVARAADLMDRHLLATEAAVARVLGAGAVPLSAPAAGRG